MLPIEDYAVIGDTRSVALVGKNGSIEWLCWPRFDSGPALWALLDGNGGAFRVAPEGVVQARRAYVEHTNVLVTELETGAGRVRLTDFMPVASEREKRSLLMPEREIVRIVDGLEGRSDVVMQLELRPEFGRTRVTPRRVSPRAIRFEERGRAAWLIASDAELELAPDGRVTCRKALGAGERVTFSLSRGEEGPLVLVPFGPRTDAALGRTVKWWRAWADKARYRGPHRDALIRSLLTLKLLSFAPSGAIVAAGTTSLPEKPGGDLNWDYRYTWIRDAAFTARVLLDLGFEDDASAFVGWLLHATRLTRPELRVLYDVYGRPPERERELPELAGYLGAKPVRVGNGADEQLQLDGYGEVIDAVARFARRDGYRFDRETQELLIDFGRTVARSFREPDSGIWETRGPRRHFTHSRVLCWVAMDRLLELADRGKLKRAPRELFENARRELVEEIESRGYNRELDSYTQVLGGATVDASLLQLSWYDYRSAGHPRMLSTVDRIVERLSAGDVLLYRNPESIEAGDNAFAICSFWLAEQLARGGGSLALAERTFERASARSNELGLFSEEIDARTGAALGNFPQAFTHLGHASAAIALEERRERGDGSP